MKRIFNYCCGQLHITNHPTFPLLVIDNSGYLEVVDSEEYLFNCNALGLIRRFYSNLRAYDKNGEIWIVDNVESKYKINGLTKFLANTFYNPSIKVTISWTNSRKYELVELKRDIKRQVDKDDDIITQFVEGTVIKKAIDESHSFSEIIQALNKYVFKVREDELYKEHRHE